MVKGGVLRAGFVFPEDFFLQDATVLAPELLGCTLVRRFPDGRRVQAVITETEAYMPDDPACHAARGPTARNASMFLPGGHAYVYFIYGMHYCLNVVTGPAGSGQAVLLRAVLVEGVLPEKTRGPGRLCRFLEVDRSLDGIDLRDPESALSLLPRHGPCPRHVCTPRIGIRKNAHVPWRFVVVSSGTGPALDAAGEMDS